MHVDKSLANERYPFTFTGSGGEYFRIWIVNVVLTVLTLYVYSAWAKVRTRRYFHGNTVLDGSSFDYHARPLQILAGRLVAVALLVAVTFGSALDPLVSIGATLMLLVMAPWAIWRSTIFNARMTSYRNVRFDFHGGLGKMYLYTLVLPFLPLAAAVGASVLTASATETDGTVAVVAFVLLVLGALAFYAIAPWVHRTLAAYVAGNHSYGRASFDAMPSTTRFYAIYIKTILVAIGVVLAAGALVALSGWAATIAVPEWQAVVDAAEEADVQRLFALAGLLIYPLFFLVGYFVSAFFRARIRNHLYATTVVDTRVRLESTVPTWALWRLLVGNLLLLVFTLGFGWPWAKVRLAHFFARHTAALASEGLHAVVGAEHDRQNALGEELGDAFDTGLDVGF